MNDPDVKVAGLANAELELPKYQRALVWKPAQKLKLIDSLLRGYPVGALLVWKVPGADPDRFQLIDGQQRVQAIRQYLEAPLTFLRDQLLDEDSMFPPEMVAELASAITLEAGTPVFEASVRAGLAEWMYETKKPDRECGFREKALCQKLHDALGLADSKTIGEAKQTDDAVLAILGHIETMCTSIGDRRIPVIHYTGSQNELPEIFERVNTQLTVLKEFDKYAAAWSDVEAEVREPRLRTHLAEKYRAQLFEAEYEIAGVQKLPGDLIHIDGYNLFEYYFALGKDLNARHSLLFGAEHRSSEPEPLGFVLPAAVHGKGYPQIRELREVSTRPQYVDSAGLVDLESLRSCLDDACSIVEAILKPYIGFKFNHQDDRPVKSHTLYQAMSLVSSVAVLKYDPSTWQQRPGWSTTHANLKKHLPQHYLLDILTPGLWGSHGNVTLLERVWRGEPKDLLPSSHYATPIPLDQWVRTLDSWFELQMTREHLVRKVDDDAKAFMVFLYSRRIDYLSAHEETWEIAHIFPVKRLRQCINARKPPVGWPINCVGNLALFTFDTNREQASRTIPEYLNRMEASKRRTAERDLRDRMFCDAADTAMPKGFSRRKYDAVVRKSYFGQRRALLEQFGYKLPRDLR